MAREIMAGNPADNTSPEAASASAATGVASPAVAAAPAPTMPNLRDTLVGAFPEWDLVPTTHFVRRVK